MDLTAERSFRCSFGTGDGNKKENNDISGFELPEHNRRVVPTKPEGVRKGRTDSSGFEACGMSGSSLHPARGRL